MQLPSTTSRGGPGGFATVGDRGVLSDGRLLVSGRSDAVTVGGVTVEPADVEALLRGAATGDVVVVAVPHPGLGQVLGAVLTDADDLLLVRAAARERLDGARRPRLWFELPTLPVTPAGKVDRAGVISLVSGDDGPRLRLV